MNRKSIAKIIACLAALFVFGGVCGAALAGRTVTAAPAWSRQADWANRWVQQCMTKDLAAIRPTPELEAKLRPIYEHLLTDVQTIQKEAATKVTEALRQHGREITAQLTPEQLQAFQKVHQPRRKRGAADQNETAQP